MEGGGKWEGGMEGREGGQLRGREDKRENLEGCRSERRGRVGKQGRREGGRGARIP